MQDANHTGVDKHIFQVMGALQRAGVQADLRFEGNWKKTLKKLTSRGVHHGAVFIGPDEVDTGVATIRDFASRSQDTVNISDLEAAAAALHTQ